MDNIKEINDEKKYETDTRTIISKNISYVGYYADIDGVNGVDGIIFADLAFDGYGEWSSENSSSYSYVKKDELNDYYISEENYVTAEWGKHPIISPVNKNSDILKNRFYIISLEDVDSKSHYWYKNAYGNISEMEDLSNAFGKGKQNTDFIIDKYIHEEYGEQDNSDIWKLIERKIKEGWFVPSKDEWTVFAVFAKNAYNLSTSNYSSIGLKSIYWSSSKNGATNVWCADFTTGYINSFRVNRSYYIRLITTF